MAKTKAVTPAPAPAAAPSGLGLTELLGQGVNRLLQLGGLKSFHIREKNVSVAAGVVTKITASIETDFELIGDGGAMKDLLLAQAEIDKAKADAAKALAAANAAAKGTP